MLFLSPEYPDKFRQLLPPLWGFIVGSGVKNLPDYVGDMGSIPGSERSPGEENGDPLQYSCLENPMDGGVCGLQPMGSQRIGHDFTTEQQLPL